MDLAAQNRAADRAQFEQLMLPHLDAAYNLARWLTGNAHDAQDVVQESYLRALRFFGGFRGGDARAWLLAIVRNVSYTWLRRNRSADAPAEFDEQLHSAGDDSPSPEQQALGKSDHLALEQALTALPAGFREIIVLRELEGLSYKEIAEVAGIPIGTVMSGLARARRRLREALAGPPKSRPMKTEN